MKNLLDKIDDINKDIEDINETINILTEQFNPLAWLVRRKIIKKIFGSDKEEEKELEDLDKKEKEERLKKSYEEWENSEQKENDIEDFVDDIKDVSNDDDKNAADELTKKLKSILEKQKKFLEDAIAKKGIDKLTVSFNDPIEFEIRRGVGKGEKLKLERTKTYDVYMVDDKNKTNKIYFTYKDWLKKYSILFMMKIKNPEKNHKYSKTSIYIVYVNENFLRDQEIKILEEKVLTHRGMVEIKSFN